MSAPLKLKTPEITKFDRIVQIDPLRRRVRELIRDLRNARKEGKSALYLQLVGEELNLCYRRYKQALRNPSGIPNNEDPTQSVVEY